MPAPLGCGTALGNQKSDAANHAYAIACLKEGEERLVLGVETEKNAAGCVGRRVGGEEHEVLYALRGKCPGLSTRHYCEIVPINVGMVGGKSSRPLWSRRPVNVSVVLVG